MVTAASVTSPFFVAGKNTQLFFTPSKALLSKLRSSPFTIFRSWIPPLLLIIPAILTFPYVRDFRASSERGISGRSIILGGLTPSARNQSLPILVPFGRAVGALDHAQF